MIGHVPEARELWRIIEDLYDLHSDKITISPAWLATEGMKKLRFAPTDNRLVYIGCHLQLRVIARGFCNKKFDPVHRAAAAEDEQQSEMFAKTLQERYPRKPVSGEERSYIKRSHLSVVDREFNVERLRKCGGAMMKHADALEAENEDRRSDAA